MVNLPNSKQTMGESGDVFVIEIEYQIKSQQVAQPGFEPRTNASVVGTQTTRPRSPTLKVGIKKS